ncbi:hypothetical protein K438DRAFT_1774170 [Mycena galopus ATCC 62051]|nr:hypothetical protein K438DRAFT_1774170 [Mycena galopus ATCC 62051]
MEMEHLTRFDRLEIDAPLLAGKGDSATGVVQDLMHCVEGYLSVCLGMKGLAFKVLELGSSLLAGNCTTTTSGFWQRRKEGFKRINWTHVAMRLERSVDDGEEAETKVETVGPRGMMPDVIVVIGTDMGEPELEGDGG